MTHFIIFLRRFSSHIFNLFSFTWPTPFSHCQNLWPSFVYMQTNFICLWCPRDLPDHATDQSTWRQRVYPVPPAGWCTAQRRRERPQDHPLECWPGTRERVWGEPQLYVCVFVRWWRTLLTSIQTCAKLVESCHYYCVQIPEKYGAVRTIADVDGEELLVGTTRNAILRGTFSDGFVAIVQVCGSDWPLTEIFEVLGLNNSGYSKEQLYLLTLQPNNRTLFFQKLRKSCCT